MFLRKKLSVSASNVRTVTKKENKSHLFKFFINRIATVIRIQVLCSSYRLLNCTFVLLI